MKCRLSESQNAEIPSLSRTHFPKDVSVALTFFTLDIMSSYYLSCIPEEGGAGRHLQKCEGLWCMGMAHRPGGGNVLLFGCGYSIIL